MLLKSLSPKSIAKFSGISAIAIALIFGGISPATASPISYEDAVNIVTDSLFSHVHPERHGRKLQANEYEHIREWQAIHKVLDQGILEYKKKPPNKACENLDWAYPSNQTRDVAIDEKLADAVFYVRHPERQGRSIGPNETAAIQEWKKLKKAMFDDSCV